MLELAILELRKSRYWSGTAFCVLIHLFQELAKNTNSQNDSDMLGTVFWCAPEVLLDSKAFSHKSDCTPKSHSPFSC